MCCAGYIVSFSRVYFYQPKTYFSNSTDPMRRTMQSTVFSRLFAVGLFERLRLIDAIVGTSEADLAFGLVCVWLGGNNVVDVGKVRQWNIRSMNTVLGIPFFYGDCMRWVAVKTEGSNCAT